MKTLTIALASILCMTLLTSVVSSSYAQTPAKPNLPQSTSVSLNEYTIWHTTNYCPAGKNTDAAGILFQTDIHTVPIVFDKKMKSTECQKYVVKLFFEKYSKVNQKSFTKNDLPDVLKKLENKKKELEIDQVKTAQKIRNLQSIPGDDSTQKQITDGKKRLNMLHEAVDSYKKSIANVRMIR